MTGDNTKTNVILVVDDDAPLSERSALILDILSKDPRLTFAGRIHGDSRFTPPTLPPVARVTLWCEARLTRLRWPAYPTAAVEGWMAALPLIAPGDAPSGAIALCLEDAQLSDRQLDTSGLREWALRIGGLPPRHADVALLDHAARDTGLIHAEITQRHGAGAPPLLIAQAGYNPKPSAVLSADFVTEKTALLLQRHLSAATLPDDPPTAEASAPARPTNVARYMGGVARTATRRIANRLRQKRGKWGPDWQLASGTGTIVDFDPSSGRNIPRQSCLMADPFLFEHDAELFLFYEAQDADGAPAWIDVARLNGDRFEPLGTALRRDYHLSFPHLFRDGDDIFMMPETQTAQRLEVWRATNFPLEWELHATALEGQYVADSVLFRHDGQWWLLTNLSNHVRFQEHSSELYLFSVDGPALTRIVAHPQNPVVIGSDVARNAGAVISHDDRLFRAAQNNSHGVYGYGLNIMEIDALTPDSYREHLVRGFVPSDRPGAQAIHHVSFAAGRFSIDWLGA